MKITIIGAGDLESIYNHTRVSKKELDELLKDVVDYLVEIKAEIIILPARGIPYNIAQMYKEKKGKKVIGVIPAKCPFYGKYTKDIIEPYLDVIDEVIKFDSWYDADGNIASLGDATLCLGISAGVMAEIAGMKYNLKYHGSKTKLIIFENTISQKLAKEVEIDVPTIYINSVDELKKIVK